MSETTNGTKWLCTWCRKLEVPAHRTQTCSEGCWEKLAKANRKLAKEDRERAAGARRHGWAD